MNNVYTGELVRLRPVRDLQEWQQLQASHEFSYSPFWGPYHTVASKLDREFSNGELLDDKGENSLAIERLDTGECIGIESFGVPAAGRLATWLGTVIDRRHWSRGFGREAKLLMLCHLFESFPIQTVWADTTAEHLRAQAGLLAVGMRRIGLYPCIHWHAGRQVAVPLYQIMREDWERMPIRNTVKRGCRS
ncbi:MAG: GNAT family protein [bacterium]